MFDLGSWGEFFIIVLAALILLGPKELPSMLRTLGRWSQKLRRLSAYFHQNFDEFIQEGEFEEFQNHQNQRVLKSEKGNSPPKKVKKTKPKPKKQQPKKRPK